MFAVINPWLLIVCAVLMTVGFLWYVPFPEVEITDGHGLDANGMPEDQDTIEERIDGYA